MFDAGGNCQGSSVEPQLDGSCLVYTQQQYYRCTDTTAASNWNTLGSAQLFQYNSKCFVSSVVVTG
jgi:hypothetical protein